MTDVLTIVKNWLPAVSPVLASTLLVVGAVQDLKTRKVAKWVTWSLLGLALLVRCAEGLWILIAFLLLVHLVDLAPAAWRFLALGLVFAAAVAWGHFTEDGTTPAVVLAWVIAYGVWRLRILGGADARIVMGLMGVYPNVVMALSLGGGLVIVSTVWLFVIRRKEMFAALRSAARNMAALEFPAQKTVEAAARPLTPALAFGALVYMWILIWLVPAPPM